MGAAIGLFEPSARLSARFCRRLADLAYESARWLHHQGYNAHTAWGFISAGFAAGAIIYYLTSLFLEQKGAAVRYVTQFREYALARKKADASERIRLLASCDLMRLLPAEQIDQILPCIGDRDLKAGEILFKVGDPGDALYIVAHGKVDVLANGIRDCQTSGEAIAKLGVGHAFGEIPCSVEALAPRESAPPRTPI
jgi:hypothetical protein